MQSDDILEGTGSDEVGASEDLINQGCDRADAGDYDGAYHIFLRAAEVGSSDAVFNQGNCLMKLSRYADAAEAFARAAHLGVTEARFNLAVARALNGHPLDALVEFAKTIDPDDSRAWVEFGEFLNNYAQPKSLAESAWRHAAELGDGEGMFALSVILRDRGECEEADSWTRRALEQGNRQARAAEVIACWERTTDIDLEGELRAFMAEFPGAIRVTLAQLLRKAKRTAEAIELLEKGAREGETRCWLVLGNIFSEDLNEVDNAISAYRNGIAAGDRDCWHNLGVTLLENKKKKKALKAFRKGALAGDRLALAALENELRPSRTRQ